MCKHFFFKANLFKEEMKKFVVLLTKEKQLRMNGKMISLTFLYSAYKISTILFFYLLVNLFKQRGLVLLSYKYLNKLIS